MASTGGEVGVADRRTARLAVEILEEFGVRAKFLRSSAELADVADDHAHSTVGGAHNPAQSDVLVAVLTQIAHFVAILGKAEQREAALGVGEIGRADVEEANAVGEFDKRVYMGGDADILVGLFRGFVDREAGFAGQLDWDRIRCLSSGLRSSQCWHQGEYQSR